MNLPLSTTHPARTMDFALGKFAGFLKSSVHTVFRPNVLNYSNFSVDGAISLPTVISTVSFQVYSLLDNSNSL
jgi:hypothetical protein